MAAIEIYKTTLFTDANLKGYWRFEDVGGTTVTDSSSASHNGTASRADINGGASGQFGYCSTFVGSSSDKITIADTSDLKPTGSFSFGGWFKTSGTGTLFSSWDQTGGNFAGFFTTISGGNNLSFLSAKNTGTTYNVDWAYINGSVNVSDNNWHFFVCVWDGSYLKNYLDGSADGQVAWSNAPAYKATNYISLNSVNNPTEAGTYFTGEKDDYFFLNGTALSATDIGKIYDGTYPARPIGGGAFFHFFP
jgi:hypothetical protein